MVITALRDFQATSLVCCKRQAGECDDIFHDRLRDIFYLKRDIIVSRFCRA